MSGDQKKSKKGGKKAVNEKNIKDIEKQEPPKEKELKDSEKPVVIKAEAYKTIILYASRYANQAIPSHQWKEIYGILIGYSDDDFVYVERAEALTYGHSTDVQLDEKHYVFIDEIQQQLDDENKGYYMIGWFHSHPGLGLFFSYIDLLNQLGFQARNSDFIGLVFDHTLLGKKKQEKIISEEGIENTITKFDTGFEIYRITDINMDINAPGYDTNYHKVDYIIDGLNKFFFANVLTELSALATQGKPLQTAYGEAFKLESSYTSNTDDIKILGESKITSQVQNEKDTNQDKLVEIPLSEEIVFDVDDFFYDVPIKKNEIKSLKLKEEAEQLIYEGNQALNNKDAFTGIEKYRQGIKKFKDLKDYNRVLELYRNITEHCISTNHIIFAEEFAEELFKLADKQSNLFYRGEGNYLLGYILLKKADNDSLESQLKIIQEASIDYEKAKDFAGAGRAYYKIGTIYHFRLNQPFQASLFYIQAIKSYNEALLRNHPLRTSLWSKAELLAQKIIEIKDIIEELVNHIENSEDKEKIIKDLKSLRLNI
ncbi:MAG: hypothetical protein ACTSQG_01040 [Promethearchaeota archaeon]